MAKGIFGSSIGRKTLMAISGLGFVGFLLGHVSGNLLLFKGDEGRAFNEYAHFMKTTPIIWVTEVIIFGLIILHIVDGIILTVQNKKARPVKYASKKAASDATVASRYASLLGGVLLIFFILHLKDFFIPSKLMGLAPKVTYDGVTMDNLYAEVLHEFKETSHLLVYVISMVALALHLGHGFQSAFQSLGLRHAKYTPLIKGLGYLLAIVIPGLFAAMPLYIYFIK